MILRQVWRRQARALLGSSRPAAQSRFLSNEPGITTATETPQHVNDAQPAQVVKKKRASQSPSAQDSKTKETKQKWANYVEQRNKFNRTGSEIQQEYNPENLIANPPKPSDVTLELCLASQTHLGHATSLWNPANSSYIYGIRQGVHIISLEVTAAYLRRTAKVVEEVARRGGLILFVGTRRNQKRAVVRAAKLARGYYIFERWVPGTLTNAQQTLGHCQLKVVDALDNDIPELTERLAERTVPKPDLVVCLNPLENEVLLHECRLSTIPTIGIIDTDADATQVTYPIPANDDSLRGVSMIAGVLGRAGEAGQRQRLKESEAGNLPYQRVSRNEVLKPLIEGNS